MCVCVSQGWHSVGSAVNVVCVGACVCVCVCVCVLETPKPPQTPDLLRSHDTPSASSKHLEDGSKAKEGYYQPGLGGIPNT